jgi:hypothetical protein
MEDKKREATPQLVIDGDTGELYTPIGMLKKQWNTPKLRKNDVRDDTGDTWDDPDAPECWS